MNPHQRTTRSANQTKQNTHTHTLNEQLLRSTEPGDEDDTRGSHLVRGSCAEQGQEGVGDGDLPENVGLELFVERARAHELERAGFRIARVVDQRVERGARLFDRGLDRGDRVRDVLLVGDVDLEELEVLSRRGVGLGHELVKVGLLASRGKDEEPVFGEGLGRVEADPRAGAGDDDRALAHGEGARLHALVQKKAVQGNAHDNRQKKSEDRGHESRKEEEERDVQHKIEPRVRLVQKRQRGEVLGRQAHLLQLLHLRCDVSKRGGRRRRMGGEFLKSVILLKKSEKPGGASFTRVSCALLPLSLSSLSNCLRTAATKLPATIICMGILTCAVHFLSPTEYATQDGWVDRDRRGPFSCEAALRI